MSDELITAVLKESGLRVLLCTASGMAREARRIHEARPASADILGRALTAGVLMGALQKSQQRINLQIECDGPLRGLLVDADGEGTARGYVKNPHLEVSGAPGAYAWRPVFGNKGFLSVIRDRGTGDFYQSRVELEALSLAEDVQRYFTQSEQVDSRVLLEVVAVAQEPLGAVAGLLMQTLPDGDHEVLESHGRRLGAQGIFLQALEASPGASSSQLLSALFPGEAVDITARFPVAFRCTCSHERVVRALSSLGKAELEDIVAKEGIAEMGCHFCRTRHVVEKDEIQQLIEAASDPSAAD